MGCFKNDEKGIQLQLRQEESRLLANAGKHLKSEFEIPRNKIQLEARAGVDVESFRLQVDRSNRNVNHEISTNDISL